MAAFSSYQWQSPSVIDSFFPCFPHQFYQTEQPQDCLDQSTNVSLINNNEPSFISVVTSKNNNPNISMDSSSLSEEQVTQKVTNPMGNNNHWKSKSRQGSSANSAQSKDMREMKGKKQRKCNEVIDEDKKKKPKVEAKKDEKKNSNEGESPKGFIHVRARRGQATDSHSLAERVRRERISERMKMLQALVPGCDKVTGKALILDEIINYVQSLQNQVEFLSMRLASMSSMSYDFGMDLDTLMVQPEQNLEGLGSRFHNMQQCSSTQAIPIADTNTVNLATPNNNNNTLVDDNSMSLLFQHAHMPNSFSQGNGQLSWDVENHRQKLIYQQSAGFYNNLCSFLHQ